MRCRRGIHTGCWGKEKTTRPAEDREQCLEQGSGGRRAEGCRSLSKMGVEESPEAWRWDLRLLCLPGSEGPEAFRSWQTLHQLNDSVGRRQIQAFQWLWLLVVAPVFPGDVDPRSVNIQLDCFLAARSSKKEVLEKQASCPNFDQTWEVILLKLERQVGFRPDQEGKVKGRTEK